MTKKTVLDLKKKVPNIEGEVVYESIVNNPQSFANVEEELEKIGWVTRIDSEGQAGIYSYQLPMAKLIRTFKEIVLDLATNHSFQEMIFPRHYRQEALNAFGWIENEKLMYELMKTTPLHANKDRSNYELLSDPVQCLGFYETLRVIQKNNKGILPKSLFKEDILRVYEDQGGWTLRNELKSRLKGGFATGFEFSGAELVWAGTREKTYKTRWEVLSAVIELVSNLNLSFRVVVGGSCSRDKKYPNLIGQIMPLYEIPTLDIELLVPLPNEDKKNWIEIGGGDIAGTRLTDNFGLKSDFGSVFSGCQGVGWQRLAYAFLSQKGLDTKSWPKIVRDKFEKATLNK